MMEMRGDGGWKVDKGWRMAGWSDKVVGYGMRKME